MPSLTPPQFRRAWIMLSFAYLTHTPAVDELDFLWSRRFSHCFKVMSCITIFEGVSNVNESKLNTVFCLPNKYVTGLSEPVVCVQIFLQPCGDVQIFLYVR